jgi:hypothetical protein
VTSSSANRTRRYSTLWNNVYMTGQEFGLTAPWCCCRMSSEREKLVEASLMQASANWVSSCVGGELLEEVWRVMMRSMRRGRQSVRKAKL